MRVGLDLDNTLVALTAWAKHAVASDLGVDVAEIVETQIYHDSFNHPDPVLQALIRLDHAFWERRDVLADAPPIPGAADAAWRLYEAGVLGPYVTRRGPNTRGMTEDWLTLHRFPPVPVRFVGHSEPDKAYLTCKSQACLADGITVLVDDSATEAAQVHAAGVRVILVDPPIGHLARRAFLDTQPDILCVPSIVEAVDHLLANR